MDLSYSPESFKKVLTDTTLRDKFKRVLARDFCIENLIFYEAVERVKQKEMPLSIPFFLNKFFRSGAEFELNLPAKMLKDIIEKLENEQFPLNVLEQVETEVVDMMYKNNFKNYLISS
jgi:hypothetical protein